MRKAIGFLIILWGVTQFLPTTLPAADDAARESLRAIEAAAVLSQEQIDDIQK